MVYWGSLTCYLTTVSVLFFFAGLNWYKLEGKYRRSPQQAIALLYFANAGVLYLVFDVPFLAILLLDCLQLAGAFMGTYFQCIGLTGGIATGKSTVSGILAENGLDIIDTDKISKELDRDEGYRAAIRSTFGDAVFSRETGEIDRIKLGNIIFADKLQRRKLEKISHPRIFRRIFVQLFKLRFLRKKPLVVLDAPLLFETKILEYFCYPILVVSSDAEKQLARFTERNQISEEEALRKISSQMPIGVKVSRADISIENNGSLKDLDKTVTQKVIPAIYQKLGYIDSS